MAKDELLNDIKTKQESMEQLTSYVTSMVEPLVPDYLKEYLKNIHIYWIHIKSEHKIEEKLNKDAQTAAPALSDSYLESPAVKYSSRKKFENVIIFHVFPEELELLKDFYFFIIFTLCSHDEQLSKGYFSHLSKNYFEEGDFYKLLNTNVLTAMYVSYDLHSNGFPKDELFTALSAEQYEKSDSHAQIIFPDYFDPDDLVFQFEEKYELCMENLRVIRKLMEIVKNPDAEKPGLALVAVKVDNNWSIVGTTKVTKATETTEATEVTKANPTIKFEGNLNWSFTKDKKVKFQFYKGRYILNWGDNKTKYAEKINDVPQEYQKIVKDLIDILKKQKHGTAAIISDMKSLGKETERLCEMNKGIKIHEFNFLRSKTRDDYTSQMGMTNIDGAVFIDKDGICHAIGMIVDGETVVEGDAGRGARYNSINNYINWAAKTGKGYFVGIIFSEDGMINVVKPEPSKWKEA